MNYLYGNDNQFVIKLKCSICGDEANYVGRKILCEACCRRYRVYGYSSTEIKTNYLGSDNNSWLR